MDESILELIARAIAKRKVIERYGDNMPPTWALRREEFIEARTNETWDLELDEARDVYSALQSVGKL